MVTPMKRTVWVNRHRRGDTVVEGHFRVIDGPDATLAAPKATYADLADKLRDIVTVSPDDVDWTNPDGTPGGRIAPTASVEPGVFISPGSRVGERAVLSGPVRLVDSIVDGDARIDGPVHLVRSHVTDQARIDGDVRINYATVSGSAHITSDPMGIVDSEPPSLDRMPQVNIGNRSVIAGDAKVYGSSMITNSTVTGTVVNATATHSRIDGEMRPESSAWHSTVGPDAVVAGSLIRSKIHQGRVRPGVVVTDTTCDVDHTFDRSIAGWRPRTRWWHSITRRRR